MKKLLTVAVLIALGLPVFAEQDITARLSSTVFATSSTNTTPSTPAIGIVRNDVLTFQAVITTTNALATNTFTICYDVSANGADWVSNKYTAAFTLVNTNTAAQIWCITNDAGANWIRTREIRNAPGSSALSTVRIYRYNYTVTK